ncbi:NYN domain-containing protein [Cryptosporangium phraense]|uniref:NYN domain-containing protein n=1 Tax=Cryptosporangium phraense TaxID=2593070 RepID=UPI00197AFAC6|nr:NYN domain-containing protein [Cryptosporangium phraense]
MTGEHFRANDGPDASPDVAAGAAPEPVLPDAVRARVVALAVDLFPSLGPDVLPGPLRRFAHFTPARRAKMAGPSVAAALTADAEFRERLAEKAVEAAGPLGEAVAAGTPPGAADPVEVAALAYLARPPHWTALVEAASATAAAAAESEQVQAATRQLDRLAEQLDRVRANAKADTDKLRSDLATVRSEADELRARVRELSKALRDSEQDVRRLTEAVSTERGRVAAQSSTADAEIRRLRSRLADAEREREQGKSATRAGRATEDARLWLLLETIGNATQGLRRELALAPPDTLPADAVAAEVAGAAAAVEKPGAGRLWAADDPARLDQLLGLPRVHLVIDGYNVTKTGFGELALEQQRTRLLAGLAGIAAQTNAEITVVFDGASRLAVAPGSPRGVRVIFSPAGETADEVIRRLVRAEPSGRPVVVVSSDKEVADGIRRAGAYAVPSIVLVKRLERA